MELAHDTGSSEYHVALDKFDKEFYKDNLTEIHSHDDPHQRRISETRGWPARHFQRWTEHENCLLRVLASRGMSVHQIAKILDRKPISLWLRMDATKVPSCARHPEIRNQKVPIDYGTYECMQDDPRRLIDNESLNRAVRHCQPYTRFEKNLLTRFVREGRTPEQIAHVLQRSERGITLAIEKHVSH